MMKWWGQVDGQGLFLIQQIQHVNLQLQEKKKEKH